MEKGVWRGSSAVLWQATLKKGSVFPLIHSMQIQAPLLRVILPLPLPYNRLWALSLPSPQQVLHYLPVSLWPILPPSTPVSLGSLVPTSRRFCPGLWLWLRLRLRPGPREPRDPRELLEPLEELLPAVEQVLVPWPWLRKLGLLYGSQVSSAVQPRSAAGPVEGSRLLTSVHRPPCVFSQLWVMT